MSFWILQFWGGSLFLLNKVFFCLASSSSTDRKAWEIAAWAVYLLGLPAWILIMISERNWIAAAVEAGSAPLMVMGLLGAVRGREQVPAFLRAVAPFCVAAGIAASLWDSGPGISLRHLEELGIAAGFLAGTWFVAKGLPSGQLWFATGNISCALLMAEEGYLLLMAQQLVSLALVLRTWFSEQSRRSKKEVPG